MSGRGFWATLEQGESQVRARAIAALSFFDQFGGVTLASSLSCWFPFSLGYYAAALPTLFVAESSVGGTVRMLRCCQGSW
jgi:hypothetical protein